MRNYLVIHYISLYTLFISIALYSSENYCAQNDATENFPYSLGFTLAQQYNMSGSQWNRGTIVLETDGQFHNSVSVSKQSDLAGVRFLAANKDWLLAARYIKTTSTNNDQNAAVLYNSDNRVTIKRLGLTLGKNIKNKIWTHTPSVGWLLLSLNRFDSLTLEDSVGGTFAQAMTSGDYTSNYIGLGFSSKRKLQNPQIEWQLGAGAYISEKRPYRTKFDMQLKNAMTPVLQKFSGEVRQTMRTRLFLFETGLKWSVNEPTKQETYFRLFAEYQILSSDATDRSVFELYTGSDKIKITSSKNENSFLYVGFEMGLRW